MTDVGYSSSSSSDCDSDVEDGAGGRAPPLPSGEDDVNNALSLVDDDTSCLIIQPPPLPELDDGKGSYII